MIRDRLKRISKLEVNKLGEQLLERGEKAAFKVILSIKRRYMTLVCLGKGEG